MVDEEVKARVKQLREELRKHNYKYYVLDNPEISDYEYDQMLKELEELEAKYPELKTEDSPTQRVGGEPRDEFTKVEHSTRVLSLANAFNEQELRDFDDRIKRNLENKNYKYIVEHKIDGLSAILRYENGSFSLGATRGNGRVGEDVTHNLKTIKSIPLKLRKENIDIELRGEVFIRKDDFKKLNQKRSDNDQSLFANPRNAAAGSIRQLDPKVAAKRPLSFIAYDLVNFENSEHQIDNHHQALEFLKELGFNINWYQSCENIEEVIKICENWVEKREEIDFEIDGLVIKVDQLDLREKLGNTSKSPRWAIAYKFPAQQKTTKVKDIDVTVGRTGALTPNAVLEPVFLDGSTVSRATLHNEDEVKRKDVRINDTVLVQKAGDVIPEVVKVIKEKRTGNEIKFEMPKYCPVCGEKVYREEGEAVTRCTNISCPAQRRESILHFVSRDAMDIEGVGPALVDQLLENEIIVDFADLYYLKKEQLMDLERMAEKSSQNVIDAIKASKERKLNRLIYALGIRHVGSNSARILTNHYSSIEELKKASREELVEINEIGPVMAESIVNFFKSEHNLEVLEKLEEADVKMQKQKQEAKASQHLEGKSFVFTGALDSYTRKEASELVRKYGGDVKSSVSSKTSYLVVGDNPGSKYDQAQELNVDVLNEDGFEELLGGGS
ncbi:MAG TPA: NAD-dependent DNA ligase LigA [Halanaerobiales bacterium]|nr:NAD-dependent DNA ligase LigA [Halanaerobiales bacterium]